MVVRALRRWLSPTQSLLDEVRALRARVEALERAEIDRETTVADQLDKLHRYMKRLRMRTARAGDDDGDGVDPISAQIIAARQRRFTGT